MSDEKCLMCEMPTAKEEDPNAKESDMAWISGFAMGSHPDFDRVRFLQELCVHHFDLLAAFMVERESIGVNDSTFGPLLVAEIKRRDFCGPIMRGTKAYQAARPQTAKPQVTPQVRFSPRGRR
jgi:hypothetical protein